MEPAGICRYPMLCGFSHSTSPCNQPPALSCSDLSSSLTFQNCPQRVFYNQIWKGKKVRSQGNGSKVQHLSRNTFTPPEISFLPLVALCLQKELLSSKASCSSALGQLKWSPSFLILAVRLTPLPGNKMMMEIIINKWYDIMDSPGTLCITKLDRRRTWVP